jgi:uncharacterized protein YdaU (DUF1376 family)
VRVNYYPFHIGDYLSATRHLSWEEDAAYRRLLDTYYTTEKPLPADLRSVCRLVLAQTDTQREAVRIVLEEFFELTEFGWINHRADVEIDAMRDKQQKQREKANKRWQKPREELGNAPAVPQHTKDDAAASNTNADAMPPTPTPTPTPTPVNVNTKSAPRFDAQAHLSSLGVCEGVARDWLAQRKTLKAAATETAIAGIQSEAMKAGVTLERALAECCSRGWRGFKAEWLKSGQARGSPSIHDIPPASAFSGPAVTDGQGRPIAVPKITEADMDGLR